MEGRKHTYDPESLLTGEEVAAGAGYENPRQYPNQAIAEAAYEGRLTPEEIAKYAPRKAA